MSKIDSQINIRIEKDLAQRAQREARRRGKTLSSMVREFLRGLSASPPRK
jgi:predicted HicB family RNase H-like nuclease